MEKNLLILVLLTSFLKADAEFILSYKLRTKNSYATNEVFYISKAMILTNKPTKHICTLPKKTKKDIKTLTYLQKYKYQLIECFRKKRVFVNSFSFNTIKNYRSQTTIKTEPIRFTVNFNDGFGIISTFTNR